MRKSKKKSPWEYDAFLCGHKQVKYNWIQALALAICRVFVISSYVQLCTCLCICSVVANVENGSDKLWMQWEYGQHGQLLNKRCIAPCHMKLLTLWLREATSDMLHARIRGGLKFQKLQRIYLQCFLESVDRSVYYCICYNDGLPEGNLWTQPCLASINIMSTHWFVIWAH